MILPSWHKILDKDPKLFRQKWHIIGSVNKEENPKREYVLESFTKQKILASGFGEMGKKLLFAPLHQPSPPQNPEPRSPSPEPRAPSPEPRAPSPEPRAGSKNLITFV